MFETLDDRIKQDSTDTRLQRILKYTAVLVLSIILFGGLYLGVRLLE